MGLESQRPNANEKACLLCSTFRGRTPNPLAPTELGGGNVPRLKLLVTSASHLYTEQRVVYYLETSSQYIWHKLVCVLGN